LQARDGPNEDIGTSGEQNWRLLGGGIEDNGKKADFCCGGL